MKKYLISLLAFCALSASAQNEIVVGDMNDDGNISISDVTELTETLIGRKDKRVINTKCNPYKSDPLAIAGTYFLPNGQKWVFNEDGTAKIDTSDLITKFEFYPYSRDIIFFDSYGFIVAHWTVLRLTKDNLVVENQNGYILNCNSSEATQISREYVDLGLPSGTLWAKCNIGANFYYQRGYSFAWGETTTISTTYKWQKGTSYTKYNKTDMLEELESEDDAANVLWGEGWYIPTKAQFEELKKECKISSHTENGIPGYTVTGKNENSIFFPCCGVSNGSSISDINSCCYYWTRTNKTSEDSSAYYMYFNSAGIIISTINRAKGIAIRPVYVGTPTPASSSKTTTLPQQ